MGFRNVTKKEFLYIKELLKKNKGNVKKVAKIAVRSIWTVNRIDILNSFKDYTTKGGSMSKTNRTRRSSGKTRKSRDYSGGILAELKRMRLAILQTGYADKIVRDTWTMRIDLSRAKAQVSLFKLLFVLTFLALLLVLLPG